MRGSQESRPASREGSTRETGSGPVPGGGIPRLSVSGTAFECGCQLGIAWREVIEVRVAAARGQDRPWWAPGGGAARKLVEKHAPHLPELMLGMQSGAGLGRYPPLAWNVNCGAFSPSLTGGECTSFSVSPDRTRDRRPISGQTKDHLSGDPVFRYLVLELSPRDAPGFLSLVYPGDIFGYGFSTTGMSAFRNSLRAGNPARGIPFDAWGLLTLCLQSVDQVREITLSHGLAAAGNILVSDTRGGSLSVESTSGGIGFREPENGLLAHTNHVLDPALAGFEDHRWPGLDGSRHRLARVRRLLEERSDRLDGPGCLEILADHDGYPDRSICRHPAPNGNDYGRRSRTTAAVVAEPAAGLLRVARGQPCLNRAVTHSIGSGPADPGPPLPPPGRIGSRPRDAPGREKSQAAGTFPEISPDREKSA